MFVLTRVGPLEKAQVRKNPLEAVRSSHSHSRAKKAASPAVVATAAGAHEHTQVGRKAKGGSTPYSSGRPRCMVVG